MTCNHSTPPLDDGCHAPTTSPHVGATLVAPCASQACWLLPWLQVESYEEEAVAPVAQLHVEGANGGNGGGVGGAGGEGGSKDGGGGEGEGGGMIP